MLKKLKKEYADALRSAFGEQTKTLYYIDEIARLTVCGLDGSEDLLQKCAFDADNLFTFKGEPLGSASDAHTAGVSATVGMNEAYYCSAVCDYAEQIGRPIEESELLAAAPNEDTDLGISVAYVRNAVSDEAFKRFACAMKSPSVSYTASFAAACEEVYYGRVRYCILPYESSDEGTLSGFMKMIRKYELYTECVCSVRGERSSTRFVLLSRQGGEMLTAKGSKRYLKVTVDSPDADTYVKLSVAASAMRLRQIKSESMPVSWDDGRYGCVLTYELCGSASPFLLFLTLFAPECSDRSVYIEI